MIAFSSVGKPDFLQAFAHYFVEISKNVKMSPIQSKPLHSLSYRSWGTGIIRDQNVAGSVRVWSNEKFETIKKKKKNNNHMTRKWLIGLCFVCGHGPLCVTQRGGTGGAAGRNHHRVCRVSLMWSGINETVLSDRNQWARLFGGLSESIILLSCCLLVLQREGQGGRGDTKMSERCCWWSRVNEGRVKGSLCVKNIY